MANKPISIPIQHIPPKSRAITSVGDKTTEAAARLFPKEPTLSFAVEDGLDLEPLADAFKASRWSDEEAAKIVTLLADRIGDKKEANIKTLATWVLQHPNDSEQVSECLLTIPPPEIEIIKVLSRAGSQKVVFLATWRLTQNEIVLKKVIASTDATEKILDRELRSHPLNMVHPNIIETYILRNVENQAFLVEKKLPEVLSDRWTSNGVHEAANLLFDIGKAVKFLHDKGLVHGDIKPDNIGKNRDTYVLLDFGICREAAAFTADVTPTGSLRTRAPELLVDKSSPREPAKVDVWALGATVYNSIKQRFPLIRADEKIPRISKPAERAKFEQILQARVSQDWDQWLDFSDIPEAIGALLRRMLEKDPERRITAREITEMAKADLSAFIRTEGVRGEAATRFSPSEELLQIDQYLHSLPSMARLLPSTRRQQLVDRLENLKKAVGFGTEEKGKIDDLFKSLV
jgi:serine/threonine protein kinase